MDAKKIIAETICSFIRLYRDLKDGLPEEWKEEVESAEKKVSGFIAGIALEVAKAQNQGEPSGSASARKVDISFGKNGPEEGNPGPKTGTGRKS